MPITFTILPDHSLVLVRYRGTVDVPEIIGTVKRIHASTNYRPGIPQLAMMAELININADFPRMHSLRQDLDGLYPPGSPVRRLSIFAPGDLAFGMSRMFSLMAENDHRLDVAAHRTEAGALEWLGRQERQISDLPVADGKGFFS